MTKDYRVKKNGESLQVYDREGYVGSISLKELCRIIKVEQYGGTPIGLAQKEPIQKDSKKPHYGTVDQFDLIT